MADSQEYSSWPLIGRAPIPEETKPGDTKILSVKSFPYFNKIERFSNEYN